MAWRRRRPAAAATSKIKYKLFINVEVCVCVSSIVHILPNIKFCSLWKFIIESVCMFARVSGLYRRFLNFCYTIFPLLLCIDTKYSDCSARFTFQCIICAHINCARSYEKLRRKFVVIRLDYIIRLTASMLHIRKHKMQHFAGALFVSLAAYKS